MAPFTHRALLILASGALLVSFSEFWFYEIHDDVGQVGILLAYGLMGYLFPASVEYFRAYSFNGLFVAACMLGFLIEGVAVPVVYSNPPFTIIWTSMAWHALLSVTLGWLLFRHVMINKQWHQKLGLNVGLGLFLGCWNAYMWHAVGTDGTGEVEFNWQANNQFGWQFLIGCALNNSTL